MHVSTLSLGIIPEPPLQPGPSSYTRSFKHSQMVELKGLVEVGCFELVDLEDIPRKRKIVDSKWVPTYKGDEFRNFMKTKSRLVGKGFTHAQNMDYLDTTSSTPASAPGKTIAVISNELGSPVFHLDVSQATVRPRSRRYTCSWRCG